ncbi:hypothetical protein FKM82_010312 [Ascaphus truei]
MSLHSLINSYVSTSAQNGACTVVQLLEHPPAPGPPDLVCLLSSCRRSVQLCTRCGSRLLTPGLRHQEEWVPALWRANLPDTAPPLLVFATFFHLVFTAHGALRTRVTHCRYGATNQRLALPQTEHRRVKPPCAHPPRQSSTLSRKPTAPWKARCQLHRVKATPRCCLGVAPLLKLLRHQPFKQEGRGGARGKRHSCG